MGLFIMKNELGLFERKNNIYVSSRILANNFDKDHWDIIYALEGRTSKRGDGSTGVKNNSLIEGLQQLGISQVEKYFVRSTYRGDNGQEYPEYLCSRDGFALLAMGFTGSKALKFKLAYINAFNTMEAILMERQTTEWLQTRQQGKLIRREETDSIQDFILYAEEQGSKNAGKYYMIFTKLVNAAVGIEAGMRNSALHKDLMLIALLEDMICNTVIEEMGKGVYYKEIYMKCKEKVQAFSRLTYLKAS